MLDAGEVATEMLYFLVGSRELDGGLMCTASHNPKAYTGAKLVERGRHRAVGRRRHPGHPPPDRGGARRPAARRRLGRGGRRRRRRSTPRRSTFIDPAAIRPLKVVLDGGNGMAGPMVGPILERLEARAGPTYWSPTATSPTTSPTRCCEENRRFIVEQGARRGRRPRDRLGRRRRPLLLHRRQRPLRRRRLHDRAAGRLDAREGARRRDPLRRARLARGRRRRRRPRRHGAR